jgi:hypothetical protein
MNRPVPLSMPFYLLSGAFADFLAHLVLLDLHRTNNWQVEK